MENASTTSLKTHTLVIKIASRCNLNCRYCYMYNMGDESFKMQPKVMSKETLQAMLYRVKEHCDVHNLDTFTLIMHGGEPLLAGKDFFRLFVEESKAVLLPKVTPIFVLQTNATLLDDEWCDLLGELRIVNMGISLDGTEAINDQNRIDHAGRGSYQRVIAGLKAAQQERQVNLDPAILCVVNVNSDPIETYEHFKSLGARNIDFLIPDATYEQPPPQPSAGSKLSQETPYADWLIQVFDRWFYEDKNRLSIRKFELIIHMLLGGTVTADNFGNLNNEVLVIETDGGIEAVDVLKICGDRFTKAGANVHTHSFDEAMQTSLANLYHLSHKKLCAQCLRCPVNEVCGGGYLPHRYKKENGFNNPTIYCRDMMKLITHIQNRAFSELPPQLLETAEINLLSYEEVLAAVTNNTGNPDQPMYEAELLNF